MIVILNLAVPQGIMNGTRGIVRQMLFRTPLGPSAHTKQDCMPVLVFVECPSFLGKPFFDAATLEEHPEKAKWLPFHPVERDAESDHTILRKQYGFVLGRALTVEKAQGMTSESGVVRTGAPRRDDMLAVP